MVINSFMIVNLQFIYITKLKVLKLNQKLNLSAHNFYSDEKLCI